MFGFNLKKIIKKVVAAPVRIMNAPFTIADELAKEEGNNERTISKPGEDVAKGVEKVVGDIIGGDKDE